MTSAERATTHHEGDAVRHSETIETDDATTRAGLTT
jgi:hypothetical protein